MGFWGGKNLHWERCWLALDTTDVVVTVFMKVEFAVHNHT